MNLISKDLVCEEEEHDPGIKRYNMSTTPPKSTPTVAVKYNQCKRGMMSTCGCKEKHWKCQEDECTHAVKSTVENRCMYFVFDKFCDCLKAQTDAEKHSLASGALGL